MLLLQFYSSFQLYSCKASLILISWKPGFLFSQAYWNCKWRIFNFYKFTLWFITWCWIVQFLYLQNSCQSSHNWISSESYSSVVPFFCATHHDSVVIHRRIHLIQSDRKRCMFKDVVVYYMEHFLCKCTIRNSSLSSQSLVWAQKDSWVTCWWCSSTGENTSAILVCTLSVWNNHMKF